MSSACTATLTMIPNLIVFLNGNYFWIFLCAVFALVVLIGVTVWFYCRLRRRSRYGYTAIDDEAFLQDRLEMDRKLQRDTERSMAMVNCQLYLRSCSRYHIIRHLREIGSRVDKHWFLVKDSTTKAERLLTMITLPDHCPFKCSSNTTQVLLELFVALQHPYVYPVLDVDFKVVSDQMTVIIVIPFNEKGSLKDLIYHSHYDDDWQEKYSYRGEGLPESHIQRLGKQILEGLMFLHDRGLQPFGQLHSGNVILQNGMARISGLENALLGYRPRIFSMVHRRLANNPEAIDTICFGHILYEMAAGSELTTFYPTIHCYAEVENKPQVLNVLRYIFDKRKILYPSLHEISNLPFFRHIDLRELCAYTTPSVLQPKLSAAAYSMLRDIKHFQLSIKKNKRSQSASVLETASIQSRDSLESGDMEQEKKRRPLSSSDTMSDIQPPLCFSSPRPPRHSASSFFADPSERSARPQMPRLRDSSTTTNMSTSESCEFYTPPSTPQLYKSQRSYAMATSCPLIEDKKPVRPKV